MQDGESAVESKAGALMICTNTNTTTWSGALAAQACGHDKLRDTPHDLEFWEAGYFRSGAWVASGDGLDRGGGCWPADGVPSSR